MLALLADTTDTPVWWFFGATVALAAVTAVLAVAAVVANTAERLAELFTKPQAQRSRNPVRERRRKAENRDRVVLLRVPDYFEDVGMTAKAGGLQAKLVREHLGGLAVDEWERWSLAVGELREADPLSYIEFERLARTIEAEDESR